MKRMDLTRVCAAVAWCVASLCAQEPAPTGRDASGAERFAAGDYTGAAVAFEKELQTRKEDPALLYNRALAAFRAGDLSAAEDAIDRYAAAPGGGRVDLHKGLLGNIRYREAEALRRRASGDAAASPLQPRGQQVAPEQAEDPIELLEAAIGKAKSARDTFASAADGKPEPAIARNLERALRLIAELEKQLEDAKKQRDEQQKQEGKDGDQQKQDDKKSDDKKKDDQKKSVDQQKSDDQKESDQKDQQQKQDDSQQQDQQDQKKQDGEPQGQERPEPKPQQDPSEQQQQDEQSKKPDEKPEPQPKDGEAKPEPKPGEQEAKQEAQPAQPRSDAPGEQQQATELSPEQRARLLEQLKDLDGRMQQIRMQSRSRARPVDRDW